LEPDEDIGGIGGSVPSGIIPDATLEFEGHQPISLPVHILKYPLEELSESEYNHVMEIPSLLGLDVINQFDLFYSYSKGKVTLKPS